MCASFPSFLKQTHICERSCFHDRRHMMILLMVVWEQFWMCMRKNYNQRECMCVCLCVQTYFVDIKGRGSSDQQFICSQSVVVFRVLYPNNHHHHVEALCRSGIIVRSAGKQYHLEHTFNSSHCLCSCGVEIYSGSYKASWIWSVLNYILKVLFVMFRLWLVTSLSVAKHRPPSSPWP